MIVPTRQFNFLFAPTDELGKQYTYRFHLPFSFAVCAQARYSDAVARIGLDGFTVIGSFETHRGRARRREINHLWRRYSRRNGGMVGGRRQPWAGDGNDGRSRGSGGLVVGRSSGAVVAETSSLHRCRGHVR